MRIDHWLIQTSRTLQHANIASARLDALILLEDFTQKDRSWLLAHPEFIMENTIELDAKIQRRAAHEPLAYIRGRSEFYGREFIVSPDTLQPRPETETIIELLNDYIPSKLTEDCSIIDVGTGSGCLAITAKLEWPKAKVVATELSEAAVLIAKQNAQKLSANVEFYLGNLLEPIDNDVFRNSVIITNLPYVPDGHTINEAAQQEPKQAIFGGIDGLDLYRELFAQIDRLSHRPGLILTESLPPQHIALLSIAEASNYTLHATRDFIQVFSRD